jgi:hypothetical protein
MNASLDSYWKGYRAMRNLHEIYGGKARSDFDARYPGCSPMFYKGALKYWNNRK